MAMLCNLFLFSQNNEVTLTGHIEGFVENADHLFVKVAFQDLTAFEQTEKNAPIDKNGNFVLHYPFLHSQDFLFLFGNQMLTLFAYPGDSIHLEFPYDPFINKDYAEEFVIVSGDRSSINE